MTRAPWLLVAVSLLLGAVLAVTLVARIEPDEPTYLRPLLTEETTSTTTAPYEPVERPRQTTSTTTPKYTKRQRVALYEAATGQVNGYPCGGDLPPCRVLRCESRGNPTARNPRSSASGLWQVLASTWAGFGGYAEAWLAPPDVQNEHARQLWRNGAGASHWASCL